MGGGGGVFCNMLLVVCRCIHVVCEARRAHGRWCTVQISFVIIITIISWQKETGTERERGGGGERLKNFILQGL